MRTPKITAWWAWWICWPTSFAKKEFRLAFEAGWEAATKQASDTVGEYQCSCDNGLPQGEHYASCPKALAAEIKENL